LLAQLEILADATDLFCELVAALLHGLALVAVLDGVEVDRCFSGFDRGFEFAVFLLAFLDLGRELVHALADPVGMQWAPQTFWRQSSMKALRCLSCSPLAKVIHARPTPTMGATERAMKPIERAGDGD
jgi:hypothetical protein